MHDDGLAYVKEPEWKSIYGPDTKTGKDPLLKMGQGLASVPYNLGDAVVEAAEDCPGECIFVETI